MWALGCLEYSFLYVIFIFGDRQINREILMDQQTGDVADINQSQPRNTWGLTLLDTFQGFINLLLFMADMHPHTAITQYTGWELKN